MNFVATDLHGSNLTPSAGCKQRYLMLANKRVAVSAVAREGFGV
jgi:hypothetical protein